MKVNYLIIILFSLSHISYSQEKDLADFQQRVEELNLKFNELLDISENHLTKNTDRIQNLINEDKLLLSRISSTARLLRSNTELLQNNTNDIVLIKNRIDNTNNRLDKLEILLNGLEINYQIVKEALLENANHMEAIDDDIRFLELSNEIISREYEVTNIKYKNLARRIDSIPEIFFCQDCLPSSSLELNWGLYPTNLSNVKAKNSFEVTFSKRIKRRLLADVFYQRLSVNTLSNPIGINNNLSTVLDNWNINILGAGIKYLIFDPKYRNINIETLFGFSYSMGRLDNFHNQQSTNRMSIKEISTFGTYFGLNVTYFDFDDKIPFEFVVGLNTFISFESVHFDSGLGNPIEAGSFLPSSSLGVRYSFDFSSK